MLKLTVWILLITSYAFTMEITVAKNLSCTQEKTIHINGNSMRGIFSNDQSTKAYYGYYACNPVKKDDIVILKFSSLLIKRVVATSGDSAYYKKVGEDMFHLVVEEKVVKTSENTPYTFTKNRIKVLHSELKKNNFIVPYNSVILLGNLKDGTKDSSRFGMLSTKKLIAKVYP